MNGDIKCNFNFFLCASSVTMKFSLSNLHYFVIRKFKTIKNHQETWAYAYLTTLLLHASSLIRKARTEAFCAGVWAWKALVFRLSVSSVCPQWASIKICKISETLSRFTPTFSKCSPRAVLAYKILAFDSIITIHHIKQ